MPLFPLCRRLFPLAAVLLLLVRPAAAADLKRVVDVLAARYHLPGAVLLVSGPEGRSWAATGTADLATGQPVTLDTRFHVASTGKMVTAVAVMGAVERGQLKLGDPVWPLVDQSAAARLANLPAASLADLLSHQSGIADCLRNGALSTAAHPSITWTAPEALALAPCRGATPPGRFAYSNTNFILLGNLLERLEQRPLAAVLAERVFVPAGMNDSTVGANPADPQQGPRLAHGYRPARFGAVRPDASRLAWASALGDAPLTTTAPDLERFLAALFRAPGTLLSAETVTAMTTDRATADPEEGYGLGIEVFDSDWGPRWGHSGRFAGYCAEAWYYPARDTIVVFLGNGDEHTPDDLLNVIAPQIFSRSAEMPPPRSGG